MSCGLEHLRSGARCNEKRGEHRGRSHPSRKNEERFVPCSVQTYSAGSLFGKTRCALMVMFRTPPASALMVMFRTRSTIVEVQIDCALHCMHIGVIGSPGGEVSDRSINLRGLASQHGLHAVSAWPSEMTRRETRRHQGCGRTILLHASSCSRSAAVSKGARPGRRE